MNCLLLFWIDQFDGPIALSMTLQIGQYIPNISNYSIFNDSMYFIKELEYNLPKALKRLYNKELDQHSTYNHPSSSLTMQMCYTLHSRTLELGLVEIQNILSLVIELCNFGLYL